MGFMWKVSLHSLPPSPHPHNLVTYHSKGQASLSLVNIRLCPVLSAIMSQLFPPHYVLQVYDCQDFASVLEKGDSHSVKNVLHIVTVSVLPSFVNLYAV
jgi:hypothetical protein